MLPDPVQSRALLVGTSRYVDDSLHDLPAVANNLTDLAEALTAAGRGTLLPQSCTVLHNPADLPTLGRTLSRLAGEATDLFLVYYAGHGLTGPRGNELYLALAGTESDDPYYSALRFDGIRRAMRASPARTRVLLLDCCFSGRAIDDVMAGTREIVLGQLDVAGTYTLTATPANETAMAPLGARNTAFTGALLSVLAGVKSGSELLTLGEIYAELLRIAQLDGLPRPQQRGTDTAAGLALARNAAYRPTGSLPPAVQPLPSTTSPLPHATTPIAGKAEFRPKGRLSHPRELVVVGKKRVLLCEPWVIGVTLLCFASLVIAGFLSNTLASSGSLISWIWWAWLLLFVGSLFYAVWRLRDPFHLILRSEGIESARSRSRVKFEWNSVASLTVGQMKYLLRSRTALYLRLNDSAPRERFGYQRLSGSRRRPPYRENATGWIVLCYLDQLVCPIDEVELALARFAGPDRYGG
jgi:hypothetical protein